VALPAEYHQGYSGHLQSFFQIQGSYSFAFNLTKVVQKTFAYLYSL
jgi:hypothetical protein